MLCISLKALPTYTKKQMIRICIFISLLITSFLHLHANNVYFHHLGNDKLPQLSIFSIYQDETGTMWFGTVEGLCRYNGKDTQFFTAKKKGPFTQNAIHSIYGNRKGTLYIQAETDILKYDLNKEQFECLKKEAASVICYKEGILWYANSSEIRQYREDTEETLLYKALKGDLGRVTAMAITDEYIWVGRRQGLTIVDSKNPNNQKDLLAGVHARSIVVDSKNRIWVSTNDHGLFQYDLQGKFVAQHIHIPNQNSISNDQVRTVVEDDSGRLWVGTFFGLNCFDPETNEWTNYTYDDNRPHSLSHSSVFALYKDMQGTLWIGTYFGGINYFNPQSNVFRFYNARSRGPNNISFPFIGNMTEDQYENLWICTEGGGLNSFNLSTHKITRYLYEPDLESAMKYNLKSIWYHKDSEMLYLGVHNGGLGVFNTRTKEFKMIQETTHTPVASNSVRGIQYYKNELIFLNASGLHKLDMATEKVIPFSNNEELKRFTNRNFIYYFFIDSKDRLWISAYNLFCIDLKTQKVAQYQFDENNPNSMGKFKVTSICETLNGDLFFGTAGSGMFKYNPETDDFDNYTEENKKIISNFCYHITETDNGYLILLQNNGMVIFDPIKNSIVYKSPNNFPINSFFEGNASYAASNGEIFVGGTNGLISFFDSQLVNLKTLDYSLYFDKLYINNKRVTPGDESNVLTQSLPFCDKIELKHNQNNISIQFASSNYSQDAMQSYEYMLEGFDKEWTPINSNTIIYTNLNPGNYKLTVREIQTEEEEEAKFRSLGITIAAPFYKTTIAYIIYMLLASIAITGTIRFFIWRSQLNAAVEFERKEKEQNEQLTQMKLRFFTNISHELRTPLTLIIAQAEYISQVPKLEKSIKQKNQNILKNATHMRNLISELLYFRKLEQGFYKLEVKHINLTLYLKSLYESFFDYAQKRNICYNFISPSEDVYAYIDPTQFGKAIYNLLSNAFKYTADEGEITMRVQSEAGNIFIQIEDNGIGIPADKLAEIFARFYQVEYRTSGFSLGTGIGLALTKEIVESHHGEVSVNSTIDKGSIFEIKLPLGKSHFAAAELMDDVEKTETDTIHQKHDKPNWDVYEEEKTRKAEPEPEVSEEDLEKEEPQYSILIVEDNEELLELLKDTFAQKYKVYTATNGKMGLEKTIELQPNIVLSDVMMPEMSGKEMCYKIKNNINLAHIPVVLLTAQDSVDQTIEGYMFGADDYVTKPFNMDILVTRCNSIVKNRQLLYRNITNADSSVVSFEIESKVDKEFIDKATQIVKNNLENLDFNMDILASELCLGRNKLYTRMKEITNLTPNEFTLNLRLQESVNLLENYKHLNVSEIALRVGFTSTKYFSRCFKTFYGITPVQWRKDKLENTETED